MYPAMRRKDRAISKEVSEELLRGGDYGILSSVDSGGQPYATPLSYVYFDDAIYFHSAKIGQKMDNITGEPRVCFTVVGDTLPLYDSSFSTLFESVMIFGTAALVEDDEEKTRVLMLLCEKYLPDHMDKAPGDIEHSFKRTAVVKIHVEHMTGKAKIKPEGA